jgi:hypothetical protein
MAKPKAPLFGFGASGKLGDAIVYGSWKGIDTAREYVVPANPNSSAQSIQRGFMAAAVADWHDVVQNGNSLDLEAWNRYAGVLGRMSGFNAYCREYVNVEVAGGTIPGFWRDYSEVATPAAAMDVEITCDGVVSQNITWRWGNSKTFFPFSLTAVSSAAGVFQPAAQNSNYAAGTRVYFYFTVGAAPSLIRSGLYTMLLT